MTFTMNPDSAGATRNYTVKMVDAAGFSADERAAAELRFRMALEEAMGGADYVLPVLKACMLARALLADLPDDEDTEAEREVIRMWEDAETSALMAALKPLQRDTGDARFEIHPE